MGNGILFSRHTGERACGNSIIDDSIHSPYACMRRENHKGICIAMMRDAARADGVCHGCRRPLNAPHRKGCTAKP